MCKDLEQCNDIRAFRQETVQRYLLHSAESMCKDAMNCAKKTIKEEKYKNTEWKHKQWMYSNVQLSQLTYESCIRDSLTL